MKRHIPAVVVESVTESSEMTIFQRRTKGRPPTIAVEGNLASGKTTLLQNLSLLPQYDVRQMPVDLWRDYHSHNLLELRHHDPVRWSFAFQSLVQLTRWRMHSQESGDGRLRILERSLHGHRHCFLEAARRLGHVDQLEHSILADWFDSIQASGSIPLDLIVYLQTSPETSMARIRTQLDPKDVFISLDDLKLINELHEQWLLRGDCNIPVAIVDAEADPQTVQSSVESLLSVLLKASHS